MTDQWTDGPKSFKTCVRSSLRLKRVAKFGARTTRKIERRKRRRKSHFDFTRNSRHSTTRAPFVSFHWLSFTYLALTARNSKNFLLGHTVVHCSRIYNLLYQNRIFALKDLQYKSIVQVYVHPIMSSLTILWLVRDGSASTMKNAFFIYLFASSFAS